MRASLTLEDWFHVFDPLKSGKVPSRDVKKIIQLMLVVIPPDRVETIAANHSVDGLITLEDLEHIYEEVLKEAMAFTPESVTESLRLFSRGSNDIERTDFNHLKRVLTGSDFTEPELSSFFLSNESLSVQTLVSRMMRVE